MNAQPPLAFPHRALMGEAQTACRPSDLSEPLRAGISLSQKWDGAQTSGDPRKELRRNLPSSPQWIVLAPGTSRTPGARREPPAPPLPLRLQTASLSPAGSSGCFLATLLRP